ncbi:uncharacterized protein LOC123540650 [Mercenaria mercenaria]|uniref:uncharacterized protein LOC123540650 n=1 Tax=Mercenaria mercenaria TaxID=6596 RepID=UPI00234EA773|nr:uncharacterized protein LOC123540650 [Mercenaria mercenaria]
MGSSSSAFRNKQTSVIKHDDAQVSLQTATSNGLNTAANKSISSLDREISATKISANNEDNCNQLDEDVSTVISTKSKASLDIKPISNSISEVTVSQDVIAKRSNEEEGNIFSKEKANIPLTEKVKGKGPGGQEDGAKETEEEAESIEMDLSEGEQEDGAEETEEEAESIEMDLSELRKFKEESFEHLKTISEKFSGLDVYSEKVAPKRKEIVEEMEYILSLHSILEDKTHIDESVKFRKEIAEFFIESNLLNIISKIVIDCPIDVDYCKTGVTEKRMLKLAFDLLFNFTDESDVLANEVAKTGVIDTCKTILEAHCKRHVNDDVTDFTNEIIDCCTGVIQNVSVRNCNVERLRSLDFTKVLQPYLKSPNEDISMTALTILANIVSEEECYIIGAHVLLVARLLIVLERGLEENDRRCSGWSCKELGYAVRNLARNDANKKLLWNLNALQILVKMARTGNDEEIYESVHAIWALAFDEEIRKNITSHQGTGVVELLLDLQKETENSGIKNACTKTLWTLREELKTSPIDAYKKAVDKIPSMPISDNQEGHIMISYQSADREMLCKIKAILKEHKFKVWMDVDEMCGSTLQAMADAVENATVVLLCYSRRYKESDNCRLEAEYAHERKKPIVPLKMELNYKPDGWLGLMLGSKLYIEFTKKYVFEERLKILFKEISRISKQDGENKPQAMVPILPKVDQPVTSKPVDEVDSAPHVVANKEQTDVISSVEQIRQWSRDDVLEWLTRNDLRRQGLEKLTGEEIALLVIMRMEASEHLYDCIRNDLKIKTLLVKARLVWALNDLTRHIKNPHVAF